MVMVLVITTQPEQEATAVQTHGEPLRLTEVVAQTPMVISGQMQMSIGQNVYSVQDMVMPGRLTHTNGVIPMAMILEMSILSIQIHPPAYAQTKVVMHCPIIPPNGVIKMPMELATIIRTLWARMVIVQISKVTRSLPTPNSTKIQMGMDGVTCTSGLKI